MNLNISLTLIRIKWWCVYNVQRSSYIVHCIGCTMCVLEQIQRERFFLLSLLSNKCHSPYCIGAKTVIDTSIKFILAHFAFFFSFFFNFMEAFFALTRICFHYINIGTMCEQKLFRDFDGTIVHYTERERMKKNCGKFNNNKNNTSTNRSSTHSQSVFALK